MLFHQRRAVAPVIATLLMVAIAVVGGMLVFVFAQDFFTQTDSMTGPTIEQVQMYGYDARDTANDLIETHEGIVCDVPNLVNGAIIDGEIFALYVRNLGNQPVVINEVNVFGSGSTAVSGNVVATTLPLLGEWTMVTDNANCTTGSAVIPIPIGGDATILIGYDEDGFGSSGEKIKVGRPIFVSIETAAGNIFTKNLINGRSVG